MAPFQGFGLSVSWSHAEYNLVLCWIDRNLPTTQSDFRYCRPRQDHLGPTSTDTIARREHLTAVLSSSTFEAESGWPGSNKRWARSCGGSVPLRELATGLPARAAPRLKTLMQVPGGRIGIAGVRAQHRGRLRPTIEFHPQKSATGPVAAVFERGKRRRNGSGIDVGEHSNEHQ
jgi:hypothetical protein